MGSKKDKGTAPAKGEATAGKEASAPDLNRRDFVQSVALAGATLVLSASGCGKTPSAPAETPAPKPTAPNAPSAAAPVAPVAPKAEPPAPKAEEPAVAADTGPVVNIALIGAGRQGRECLANDLLKLPFVKFKAVCDIWDYNRTYAARMLKKRGHPVTEYSDYQEMLDKEKDIQAVIVATPDWMHAEHTCACLKAGKHVYCEKPMSNSLEQAKTMVLAARETKKLLQIGHQRYSNPRYLHCLGTLLKQCKLLGRITHGYGQWNRSARDDFECPKNAELPEAMLKKHGYDSAHHFLNWRHYKKYGGGPIADLGAHQVGVFGWLLGANPKAVMASGGVDYYTKHEWYDNVLTILEYDTPEGPVRAFYQVLTTTGSGGYFERLMGLDGTLQISEDPGKCKIYSEGRLVKSDGSHPWEQWLQKKYLVREKLAEEPKAEGKDDAAALTVYKSKPPEAWLLPLGLEQSYHLPHLMNFFDAVRKGTPLNCPPEVAFVNNATVLKINEAVAAGKRLELKPEDFTA